MAINARYRPVISVLVPVHNVEPYLSECLDSILNQSFSDWEMLLVDDGSTDESGHMCDTYASVDTRIRVFHQKNQGLSAARNTGIENAKGSYLCFIDADDVLLSSKYFEILLDTAKKANAQIVVCGTSHFRVDEPAPDAAIALEEDKAFSGRAILESNPIPDKAYYPYAVTARLFRKECFDGIRFPLSRTSEDEAISPMLLLPVDTVAYSKFKLYGYRQRESSLTHTRSRKTYLLDTLLNLVAHISYYTQHGEYELARKARKRIESVRAGLAMIVKDE